MAEPLVPAIRDIRSQLERGAYRQEAHISLGVVSRLLAALDWNVYDPGEVSPEFPIGSRRADYALCGSPRKPLVLLEVKDVGKAGSKGEEQLFQYCFHQGVPIAVLTDGRSWKLFFPAGAGTYDERCFARLDLIQDEPDQVAEALTRFLRRDHVRSGEAQQAAWRALKKAQRDRKARAALPSAWAALLRQPSRQLVKDFAARVEDDTGVRPEESDIRAFLWRKSGGGEHPVPKLVDDGREERGARKPSPNGPDRPDDPGPALPLSLTVLGVTRRFRTGRDVLVAALTTLAERDPSFLERFAAQVRGRSLVYLARDRNDLYPGDPAKCLHDSRELPGGWWLGVHSSRAQKEKLIRRACELASLRYGKDLEVHLPTTHRKRRGSGPSSFTIDGETRRFAVAKDLLSEVFSELATRVPTFCERFATEVRGHSRPYLARDRYELYPNDPARCVSESRELPGGWWLGLHMPNKQKEKLIRRACEVAGLHYGTDLEVHLPTTHKAKAGDAEA